MKTLILIGIGTYKRNELLDNAIKHLGLLTSPDNCELQIVISDNNPDKSAYQVFENNINNIPFKMHYIHEPQKSIAAVRNAVLKKGLEINAHYIAFLDDDEYPDSNWIKELYDIMQTKNADGATSYPTPIVKGCKQAIPYHIKRRKQGMIRNICITNSVIFSTKIIKEANIWFDTNFGLMTGEDVDFFGRASNKGFRFVWCNKELIYDIIPDSRLTMEWRIDRAFNNGYLKIFLSKKGGQNISHKTLSKIIFDLFIFSFITFCTQWNSKLKEICILKLMDCFGKIKSIYSEKPYEHYKRE